MGRSDAGEITMPATRIARASPDAIREASAALAAGALVAFPTETVYGLGADATNDTAVAKLYAAKHRPSFNPLIVHVADLAAAERLAAFDGRARALAGAFWPGALTLVLRKLAACPVGLLATAGLDTVAVRVPNHPVARDILRAFAKPVAAPSANRSGSVSPTSAEHVRTDLDGRIDLVIDDGPSPLGVESTILACLDDRTVLLRPGAIGRETIGKILGHGIAPATTAPPAVNAPLAPGMLASHYAPHAALRMNAVSVAPGEALLAFGPALPADAERAAAILNLSGRGLLAEAAANLFAYLRRLDATGATAIAVMPIPEEGLGEAINDRLRHAAAPRETRASRS
jgi:L-threonylcarbamoyladenylate synthase